MPTRLQSCQTFFKVIVVLLLVLSSQLLSQPVAVAVIGDIAEVSPGKIPPVDKDHYLGSSTFQVQLEYPRSFILQETIGDLVFKLITKEPVNRTDIYIPPEFKVSLDKTYVWSSINNSYGQIGITKLSSSDKIAPNWYDVSVTNGGNATKPATKDPKSGHVTKGTIWNGNHTIRVFNATAPSIVGRYFFKAFTNGTSVGATNFPSVVVSADPNPAYVSGWIKYGGHINNSYGLPIGSHDIPPSLLNVTLKGTEGGKVYATGVTADGRIVVGQAFFNSISSNYTLYGLAPGRYTLNATAAGFAPAELSYEIALKAGQSLHGVDIFLEHSPSLTVVALSDWMGHPEPWGYLGSVYLATDRDRRITFEILDYANLTVTMRNETTKRQEVYHVFNYNGSRDLDGHIPQESAGYVAGIAPGTYYIRAWVNNYIQPSASNEYALTRDCAVVFSQNEQHSHIDLPLHKTGILNVVVHFKDSYQAQPSGIPFSGRLTVEAYDIDDVLRARNSTFVAGPPAGPSTASVELTGLLNTTRDYGLPSGEYVIMARLTDPTLLGVLFGAPLYVSVGKTYLPSVYLRGPTGHRVTIGEGRNEISFFMLLQGGLDLTIWPVTSQKPLTHTVWKYPGSEIRVEIRDTYGLEVFYSISGLRQSTSGSTNMAKPVIGIDEGTYSIYVFTYGYVQKQLEQPVFFSVARGGIADVSVFMVKGVEIGITLVFQKQKIIVPIDTYKNPNNKVPVRFEIYDSRAQFVGANATYVSNANTATFFSLTIAGFKTYYGNAPATSWLNYYDTTDGTLQTDCGLKPDQYTIKVFVPGYHQENDPVVDLRTGVLSSVVIALERMGHLFGVVHTINMYLDCTVISWCSVDVIGKEMMLRTCTLDGFYELWLIPGSYLVIYSIPSYRVQTCRLQISEGSDVTIDSQLWPFEISPGIRPGIVAACAV